MKMELKELFDSKEMELPLIRKQNAYIIDDLKEKYEGYLRLIDSCPSIVKNKEKIEAVSSEILSGLELSLEGKLGESYDKFKNAVGIIEENLKGLITPEDVQDNLRNLYRIRVEKNTVFGQNEMFHIPFEKRHCVKTQRYSIPGLPCLYLGGSSYICWEEMGRPPIEDIHIVRIEAADSIKILDFGHRPSSLSIFAKASIGSSLYKFSIDYAVCWPLIAACSIKVKDDGPFKVEYVVPQMLLRWISEKDGLDGIRYFSTKFDRKTAKPQIISNFAFPVKKIKKEGLCDYLLEKFTMTRVIPWGYARNISVKPTGYPPIYRGESETFNYLTTNIEFLEGLPGNYLHSEFGKIESFFSQERSEGVKCFPAKSIL